MCSMHPGLPNSSSFTQPFPFPDPSLLSLAPPSPRLAALHACHVSAVDAFPEPWGSQGDTPTSLGKGCCCPCGPCCLCCLCCCPCCFRTSVMYWVMTLGCCPESLCPVHWCLVCTVLYLLPALLHISLHGFCFLFCLHTPFELQPLCLYPAPGTIPW